MRSHRVILTYISSYAKETYDYTMEPLASILIPTYERADTIKYVLEGLKRQTSRDFEVIVVFKPGRDETEKILEAYSKEIPVKVITQKSGTVTAAYNLGLKAAGGKIIAFLDDDAIPYPDWLQAHMEIYKEFGNVGGVSGIEKSAEIREDKEVAEIPKEHIRSFVNKRRYWNLPWSHPLQGMSDWLIYFGKDGLVHHKPVFLTGDLKEVYPSLLLMGANMSVKKEAVEGIEVNEDLFLGFAFEQVLSLQIWQRGYSLLFNPKARVMHVIHEESTGRFYRSRRRAALRDAEYALTFLSLRSKVKEASWFSYVLGIFSLVLARILRARSYGVAVSAYRAYGLLYGLVIATSSIISDSFAGAFSVRNSLARLL